MKEMSCYRFVMKCKKKYKTCYTIQVRTQVLCKPYHKRTIKSRYNVEIILEKLVLTIQVCLNHCLVYYDVTLRI